MKGSKIIVQKDQVLAKTRLIESDLYFYHGSRWYCDSFIAPVTISALYIVFIVIHSLVIGLALLLMYNMLPLKEKTVMILQAQRPAGTFVQVSHLRTYPKPIDSILVALVKNYVAQRERYILKDDDKTAADVLKIKQHFIQQNSSASVSNAFNKWTDGYNSITGDFLIANIQTNIRIDSATLNFPQRSLVQKCINYFLPSRSPTSAMVYFTSVNARGRERNFKVNIQFEANIPKERHNPLDKLSFIVTAYDIARI